jgi:hypothetical protein
VKWSQASLESIDRLIKEGRAIDSKPAVRLPGPDARSEKQFQAEVVKLAKANGWLPWSCTISRKSQAGWPDLTLIRGNRIVFAELKFCTKRSAAQLTFGEALSAVGGNVEYYCWRPEDWPQILEVLK